ncbi:MAG: class I SAM-dependent methyltransferase [Candidatus Peregrinibacteria bacterium]
MGTLGTLKRRVRAIFKPEKVLHRGQILPGKNLRFGGAHFLDHETFLAAGERDARKLIQWCGLTVDSAVLDIGCGTGRLAIGIVSTLGDIRSYCGIDVSETAIDWCTRFVTSRHPFFIFRRIDVRNERYNPSGLESAETRLPLQDSSVDVISLYSVFSHMRSRDVCAYLREFRRILRPEGSVFLTAFVEEGVRDEEENPTGYQREWKGTLHCMRFSLSFFRSLAEEAGLQIIRCDHGTETDGQSAFLLQHR